MTVSKAFIERKEREAFEAERLDKLWKIMPYAGNLQTAFELIKSVDFWLKAQYSDYISSKNKEE